MGEKGDGREEGSLARAINHTVEGIVFQDSEADDCFPLAAHSTSQVSHQPRQPSHNVVPPRVPRRTEGPPAGVKKRPRSFVDLRKRQKTPQDEKSSLRTHASSTLEGEEVEEKGKQESKFGRIKEEVTHKALPSGSHDSHDQGQAHIATQSQPHAFSDGPVRLGYREMAPSLDQELRDKELEEDPLIKMRELDPGLRPDSTASVHDPVALAGVRNRYNILPGPDWDGQRRGNGFEGRFLTARREFTLRKKNARGVSGCLGSGDKSLF